MAWLGLYIIDSVMNAVIEQSPIDRARAEGYREGIRDLKQALREMKQARRKSARDKFFARIKSKKRK